MATSYTEFKSRVLAIDDYKTIIEEARREYGIETDKEVRDFETDEIPFNLEQEYFDCLIDEGRIDDARRILDRMKISYEDTEYHNFIESSEYRLRLVIRTTEFLKNGIEEAKREFNHHTINLITIVVGIITIFGSANQTLVATSYTEGVITFCAISGAVILLVLAVRIFNK